jgi:DHA1 family tetracycline resistance protein-like MFS transporter
MTAARATTRRQAGIAFILLTVLLDVIGFGIIIPVLPELVTDLLGGDSNAASTYYGFIAASFALMQFLFAPLLGALSDQVGRRPVILIALFGYAVNYALLALAPSVWWLFAARLLSGITGASVSTANAYIADISTDDNRTRHYGLLGAAFGLGFIIGPGLGGVLGHLGPRVPFWFSMAIVLVNWVYGLLVLPESLPVERRRPFSWARANPFTSIANLRRYPLVLGLSAAFVLLSLGQRGMESVWVLYTDYRYGWQAVHNGLAMALVGVLTAAVQAGLVRVVVPRIGERRAIVVGLLLSTVSLALCGLAAQGWMMLAVLAVAALGGLAPPAIQSLVARSVAADEQGSVQGTITSLMSLTAVVAPLIATQLFACFTGPDTPVVLPGAPFFMSASLVLGALLVALPVLRRRQTG